MAYQQPDKRSFILGMITAFSECVAGGCKRLALSPPLTGEEYSEISAEAYEIIERHGLVHFHEENQDMPEAGRFEWILIAAGWETIDRYLALRAQGLSPAVSLEPFYDLLSYDPAQAVRTGYDAYRAYFPLQGRQQSQRLPMIEAYFDAPYWVVDPLPEQVPPDSPGRFFAAERYWLRPERLRDLRRRFGGLLLRLNCYEDMEIMTPQGEGFGLNPEPEKLMSLLCGEEKDLCVFLPGGDALITVNHDDIYMTVYHPSENLLRRLRLLAGSEGLFVWKPEQTEGETQ